MDADYERKTTLHDQAGAGSDMPSIPGPAAKKPLFGAAPPSYTCAHRDPDSGCGSWQLHQQHRYRLEEVRLNNYRCPECNHADGLQRE